MHQRMIRLIVPVAFCLMILLGEGISSASSGYPLIIIPGTYGSWLPEEYSRISETLLISIKSRIEEGLGVEGEKPYLSFYRGYLGPAYLDPFGRSYDGLIGYLEENGLKREQDYWVFGYDTLSTSIEVNAENLGHFVDYVKKASGSDKVDIIAHSQGGLIARQYIQFVDGCQEGSVSGLMMVATPNRGVVTSYLGIDHAQFIQTDVPAITDFGLNFFLSTILDADTPQKKVERLAEMRNGEWVYAPAYEMLPTFHYLKDMDGENTVDAPCQPLSGFLEELNSRNTERLGRVQTMVVMSTGTSTLSGVVLTPIYKAGDKLANRLDQVFDRYVNDRFNTDMHPALDLWDTVVTPKLQYDPGGDGVVLLRSANLGDILKGNYREITLEKGPNHTEYFTPDGFPKMVKLMNGTMEGFLGL